MIFASASLFLAKSASAAKSKTHCLLVKTLKERDEMYRLSLRNYVAYGLGRVYFAIGVVCTREQEAMEVESAENEAAHVE